MRRQERRPRQHGRQESAQWSEKPLLKSQTCTNTSAIHFAEMLYGVWSEILKSTGPLKLLRLQVIPGGYLTKSS